MQIVIDIDEESYEHIKAYSNEEVLPIGWYAIINGTPLPEHHGRIIEDMPSVTPKAEWIPISEKPTEGKYLVTGQYRKIRYVDIATFDGEDAEDTYSWDSYSDEYKIERRKHKVVAYMPLPQPYKEESEEKE